MRWIVLIAATGLLAGCSGGSGPDDSSSSGTSNTDSGSSSSGSAVEVQTVDLSYLPAPYSEADYDTGRRLFRRCGSCHTVAAEGGNRAGPNLHGIFGSTAGTVDGFDYSMTLENADFVWTPEQLDGWLANPREFLPGNRMSFVGLREEEDRRNVIAYLMHETGYSAAD
ncbi:c-type cytochrome [Hyphobacterium sp.]|uniref:c-type cytochrome n=1 Tax=Hyphobacterium sp. TaxID=2004662 RepID=UPI00374837A4